MNSRLMWDGVAVLSVAAGYGVFSTMQTGYPLHGSVGGIPGWSDPARVAAGVGVAGLCAAVVCGLIRVVRSPSRADRGLVVLAWTGWTLFGSVLAVGFSLWASIYTLNTLHYFTFTDWAVARGLIAGLVWAGVALAGLSAWQRGQVAIA